MDGEAQPAAAHISAMDTLLDYAHNEVTPLVECSHTPMGQCRPKEDRPRMTDFSGSKGGPFRALRTEGRSQVGIVKGRGGFILLDCLPHEAASRVACRCACILIGLICSPIGRCRLIKKIKKSDDCLAGRSIICWFFLTGPWEEESGRAQGAESLSKKKAIRECGEAKLISTQWGHSVLVSAVSAGAASKHETH